jgi:hypothetical protein
VVVRLPPEVPFRVMVQFDPLRRGVLFPAESVTKAVRSANWATGKVNGKTVVAPLQGKSAREIVVETVMVVSGGPGVPAKEVAV